MCDTLALDPRRSPFDLENWTTGILFWLLGNYIHQTCLKWSLSVSIRQPTNPSNIDVITEVSSIFIWLKTEIKICYNSYIHILPQLNLWKYWAALKGIFKGLKGDNIFPESWPKNKVVKARLHDQSLVRSTTQITIFQTYVLLFTYILIRNMFWLVNSHQSLSKILGK